MAISSTYQVTFTLSPAFTGTTEADTFTIIGKHCNGSDPDTTIDTGVLKADLITGVTYTIVDTISGGTITSTGDCVNSVNWTGLACEGEPSPTPTPTGDGGAGKLFKVRRCNDDQEYLIADDISCIEGNPSTPPQPNIYVVGEYIQMTDGTSCTGEQTSYCAEIISVDQSGTRDAVLIKHELLNRTKGCANTECIE
tara:strand:+ start:2407 stop:2994 length:588 start_codon:yes stop_codon:yes gene_type:complete